MKKIYIKESNITMAIVLFFILNLIYLPLAIASDFMFVSLIPLIIITFICMCYGWDSITFRRNRKLAMSKPPVTTGEIIGYRVIQHHRANSTARLYVRLEDGRITETPQIEQDLLSKIISEKVNIYRYNYFLYVGDIVCIPEEDYYYYNHIENYDEYSEENYNENYAENYDENYDETNDDYENDETNDDYQTYENDEISHQPPAEPIKYTPIKLPMLDLDPTNLIYDFNENEWQ